MWVGSITLKYVNYIFTGSSNKVGRFIYYPYVEATLGSSGGVVLTPIIIPRNYYSWQHYH